MKSNQYESESVKNKQPDIECKMLGFSPRAIKDSKRHRSEVSYKGSARKLLTLGLSVYSGVLFVSGFGFLPALAEIPQDSRNALLGVHAHRVVQADSRQDSQSIQLLALSPKSSKSAASNSSIASAGKTSVSTDKPAASAEKPAASAEKPGQDTDKKGEAASSEKIALVERCLAASGWHDSAGDLIKDQIERSLSLSEELVRNSNISDEEKQKRLRLNGFMKEIFLQDIDVAGEIREIIVELFAERFTTEEVNGLLAYFESSTGKKAVEKTPQLSKEAASLGEILLGAKVDRALKEAVSEVTDAKIFEAKP